MTRPARAGRMPPLSVPRLLEMARAVMDDLGRGHRETAYKRALAQCLYEVSNR